MELNNIVEILSSDDIEIRKLAETYIIDNYYLNFDVYISINWNNYEFDFSLTIHKDPYLIQISAKEVINNIVKGKSKYPKSGIRNLLTTIKKYNGIE